MSFIGNLIWIIFGGLIVFIEYAFPTLANIWINITAKCAIITLLFPVVVYVFKLEPEIVDYFNKFLKRNEKMGK